jgi:hypothetical protein
MPILKENGCFAIRIFTIQSHHLSSLHYEHIAVPINKEMPPVYWFVHGLHLPRASWGASTHESHGMTARTRIDLSLRSCACCKQWIARRQSIAAADSKASTMTCIEHLAIPIFTAVCTFVSPPSHSLKKNVEITIKRCVGSSLAVGSFLSQTCPESGATVMASHQSHSLGIISILFLRV